MIYQATPDYYRNYIEHGWAKDAAAKVHKYIERWKNAAGKWVYRYKKPESHPDSSSKFQSRGLASLDPQRHKIWAKNAYYDRNGIRSRDKYITKARQNAKRAFIKRGTGYSGSSSPKRTLTSRGYSGSRGSNLNNKATSNKLKNRSYYRDKTGWRSTVASPRNYGNLSNRGYSDSTGFDSKNENDWFVTDTRPGKVKIGNGPEKYEIFNIKKDKNGWTRYDRKKRTTKYIQKWSHKK